MFDKLTTVSPVNLCLQQLFTFQMSTGEEVASRSQIPLLLAWALTIHKAQGSQWEEVQVFAPDLFVAARMGRTEAGVALWKRLAYVAITRAQHRLHWVVRNRLGRPLSPLTVADLPKGPTPLSLDATSEEI